MIPNPISSSACRGCRSDPIMWYSSPTRSRPPPMISRTHDIGNHCDICATVITLPFVVNLYGQDFTTAQAGSKGYLAFGTAYMPFDVRCLPFSNATYVMAPFWVDQYTAQTECTSC